MIITRSHPCQQDLGDEEEEVQLEEGSSEYDWLVIDTALDVVVGLAAALGPAFGELWKIFEKPILKLASSTEDLHRSTAVGTVAEIIKYAGEAITPFTESLGQAVARRLSDPDPLAKSNAAYAIGLLILNSADTGKTFPLYPQLWEKLEPLLSVTEMRMTDNVAGAVSRMMLKNPDGSFVAEALPAVVKVLPLQEDYEENSPIYQNIFKLCKCSLPSCSQGIIFMLTTFFQMSNPTKLCSSLRHSSSASLRRRLAVLMTSWSLRRGSLYSACSRDCEGRREIKGFNLCGTTLRGHDF